MQNMPSHNSTLLEMVEVVLLSATHALSLLLSPFNALKSLAGICIRAALSIVELKS